MARTGTRPVPGPFPCRGQAGLTLIEVMVSSLILGLTVIAVVSVLRTARDIEYHRNLERQAMHLAYSTLEDASHHYAPFANYQALASPPLIGGTLDPNTPRPIACLIQISVLPAPPTELSVVWNGVIVRYKAVETRVSWVVDGTARSVLARKIISAAR